MKIEKELRIKEIAISYQHSIMPIRITLIDPASKQEREKEYVLTMDKRDADSRGIPDAPNATGKMLICTITDRPHKGSSQTKTDVLFVESLSREERVTPYYTTDPPTSRAKIIRTLTLATPDGGDGAHFHPLPCPCYRFAVELSEEEYRECKKLLPHSVFEVKFKFKS